MSGCEDAAIMARRETGRLNGIGFGTWAWGNQLVWGTSPNGMTRGWRRRSVRRSGQAFVWWIPQIPTAPDA